MTLVGIMNGQVPFAHVINAIFGTECALLRMDRACAACDHADGRRHGAFAWAVQKFVFRHLVGQEPIILFMATIGLAYFLEGVGDLMWGSEIKNARCWPAAGHQRMAIDRL